MTVTCPKCANRMETGAAPPPIMICGKCGEQIALRQGASLPRKRSNAWFALGCLVFLVPMLAAIAIPNFIKFQSRAKQAECRANLRGLYTAERAYYTDHHAYTTHFADLGFKPERGNRYAYFLGDGPLAPRDAAANDLPPDAEGLGVDRAKFPDARVITSEELGPVTDIGLRGRCPKCEITIVCAGNVDHDPLLDVWSVSSDPRPAKDGHPVPPGELQARQDDL